MNENSSQNEEIQIDLKQIVLSLWSGRKEMIVFVTLFCFIGAAYSTFLPNIFESRSLLSIKSEGGDAGLSQLANQFSSVAA